MTDQNNSNQVVRELKQLDVKEPEPSIINIQELRGRNANEELHTLSIRQPPQTQYMYKVQYELYTKKLSLPPPISQSNPASVSMISPKPISDLDTDQGETIDVSLKSCTDVQSNTNDDNWRYTQQ